jgi:cell division protein FtsW (lipid II flippase)
VSSDYASPRTSGPLDLLRRLDARVVLPALLLVAAGLWSIGVAAKPEFVFAQLRWCGVGVAATCVVLLVPYRRMLDLAWPAWGVSIAMLAAVLFLGESRNGARRWFQFAHVGLQPSEFAKVAQVLVLARYIRFRRDHRTFQGLFVPFLLTLVPIALVFMEPDLGTAAMFVPVLFAMLWAAGARTKHLVAVVALGVASLPVLYVCLPANNYQERRVRAFLASVLPEKKSDEKKGDDKKSDEKRADEKKPDEPPPRPIDTFQRDEAVAAVAQGGFFGHSATDEDPPQYERVPESWTDFVFVVHADEHGFVGVFVLLALWAGLLGGLAMLAAELKEPAARLLCVGAMTLLGAQAVVNMAMTMGAFPVTGVPLPFVSYGGSSMLASWLLLALVLNAKARQPMVFSVGDFD